MDVYLFILCLGFGGLLLMSLLGLSHQHSGSHHHGGQARGGSHGHGGTHNASHGAHLKGKAEHHSPVQSRPVGVLLTLISPRVIFGLLLGFGAAGVLLEPFAKHWPLLLLPLLAGLAAWVFEWRVVQPLWRVLFGFASKPAQTLDHLVLEEGRAVTNFDGTGHGLIAVDLDGQVRQLLGSLSPEERATGERIRTGDRVFIRAINAQRNTCTVSRLN